MENFRHSPYNVGLVAERRSYFSLRPVRALSVRVPGQVVAVLRKHKARQGEWRLRAGSRWVDSGLVFTSNVGTPLDASHVRRDFRLVLKSVTGLDPKDWTPCELRHSFVSLLSSRGVHIEEIARLVGHAGGSKVTELVYRRELRPRNGDRRAGDA